MSLGLILGAIAVLSVFFILKEHFKFKERQSASALTKDCVSFVSNTLTVHKRDCNLPQILEAIPYERVKFTDKPEKLVYTGVTVGGVTTGGWHKTGGFQGQEMGKSGKVQLMYFEDHGDKMLPREVHKIVLSPEVLKQAKASPIKKYLDGNSIVIMREPAHTAAAVTAMELGHKDTAFNIVEEAKIAALPTYEKCRAILDWLSDVGPSASQKAAPKKAINKKPILIGCAVAIILVCSVIGYNVSKTQKEKAQHEENCQALHKTITVGAPKLGITDLEVTQVEYAVDEYGNRTSYLLAHANSEQFGQLSYEDMVWFYRSLNYHATDYNPDLNYFAQCILCADETDGLRIHSGGHEYKCSFINYKTYVLYQDGVEVYRK